MISRPALMRVTQLGQLALALLHSSVSWSRSTDTSGLRNRSLPVHLPNKRVRKMTKTLKEVIRSRVRRVTQNVPSKVKPHLKGNLSLSQRPILVPSRISKQDHQNHPTRKQSRSPRLKPRRVVMVTMTPGKPPCFGPSDSF